MEDKEKNREKDPEIQIEQSEVNRVGIHNTKIDQPSSANLLNDPSDFIITQNPLDDLRESKSSIIHIKNTCKNSFCNCYVNCCFGHSIIFNTFLNTEKSTKYLFQTSASIIPGCRCFFKRNVELQATFSSVTKSTTKEISSNNGTPYALMDKIDAFCCCNYKEEILMPVKIIPENRIAGTVVLKPLKDKCPCACCECIPYWCCFPFFPIIPCCSDCCPDCNPKSDSDGCKCCSSDTNSCCCGNCPRCKCGCCDDSSKCCSDDPNRCCCGICPRCNCECLCGCDCSKCCSNDPNRCCCGICQKPSCCAPNRCCCGLCPKPNCGCCDDNRSCCCCCCCCCNGSGNDGSGSSCNCRCCCKTFDYCSEIYDSQNILKYRVFYDYSCKCGCKCLRRKLGLNFKIYDPNNNPIGIISGINDNKDFGLFFDDSYSYKIDFPLDATPDLKLTLLHCIYSLDTLCLY